MSRSMALLLSLAVVLFAAGSPDPRGHAAVVSVAIVALLVSALVARHGRALLAPSGVGPPRGGADDERCLHGAFRRLCSPDTPGCPRRPRAPGLVPDRRS